MIGLNDYSFSNKKAIIRVDFNVPVQDGKVSDDTRIKAALPTINKVLKDGGAVILMSHLGRPKGKEEKFSLKVVAEYLSGLIDNKVSFAEDCRGDIAKNAAENLQNGEVLLLENLRFYDEEKKGDENFAKELASLADCYINDAFGTAHRAHASTTVIAQFFPNDSIAGFLMEKEVKNIERVLNHGESPVLAIVGGAKVSSKIDILENLVGKVDELIIGGGMAFTFLKALGHNTGKSLVEDDKVEVAKKLIEEAKSKGVNLLLPTDAICNTAFSETEGEIASRNITDIADNEMGLDVGEASIKLFEESIAKAKTILWNGPMGVFEMAAFAKGTIAIAKKVAEATDNGAFSVVGGGDSVAAVNQFELSNRISHVSTGGGAMLEFIEGKVLPGIAALK